MFDVLVIGGGVAGMQCALVLGSAHSKVYATDKKIGVILHQKSSDLQSALFNNVLGIPTGTKGKEILKNGKKQLSDFYQHIIQIENEKVFSVEGEAGDFTIKTNKKTYKAKLIVVALGYSKFFDIEGLNEFTDSHPRAQTTKERIWLINENHLVKEGVYVAGTLAGWRSQFAIAAGSGAQVATDILTLWNSGIDTKVHDKVD